MADKKRTKLVQTKTPLALHRRVERLAAHKSTSIRQWMLNAAEREAARQEQSGAG